jgi:hypothetical protein
MSAEGRIEVPNLPRNESFPGSDGSHPRQDRAVGSRRQALIRRLRVQVVVHSLDGLVDLGRRFEPDGDRIHGSELHDKLD